MCDIFRSLSKCIQTKESSITYRILQNETCFKVYRKLIEHILHINKLHAAP